MGSRGSLLALSLVAALLAVAVVVDRPARPAAVDTRILPELRDGDVVGLRWIGAGKTLELRRVPAGWFVSANEPADSRVGAGGAMTPAVGPGRPADPVAVERLLGALEFLRFERRVPAPADESSPRHSRLTVVLADGRELDLAMPPPSRAAGTPGQGAPLPWLERGSQRYLVREASARLLQPGLPELRDDAVFAFDLDGVSGLDIGRADELIVLSGAPWRVHAGDGAGQVRADPRAVAALLDRLSGLRAEHWPDREGNGGEVAALRVRVRSASGDQVLAVLGPCPGHPDLRRAQTRLGAVCVSAGAVDAISSAVPGATALIDRRATSFDPADVGEVVIERPGDGQTCRLERRGATWNLQCASENDDTMEYSAEPAAVESALAALGEPFDELEALAEDDNGADAAAGRRPSRATQSAVHRVIAILRVMPRPGAAAPAHEGEGEGEGEVLTLLERAGRRYVRRGAEAVVFAAPADAFAAWLSPAVLRSRQIIDVEPTRIRALEWQRAGAVVVRFERGELAGEWRSDQNASPSNTPIARDAVARLRADSVRGAGTAPPGALRLVIDLTPPPGASETERLELALWKSGLDCLVQRVDQAQVHGPAPVFSLGAATCRALQVPET